jgi:signal transduction histidine kinase
MTWAYTYDPHLWPALVTTILTILLGWYSWRRRNVSAAKPFAIGCLFASLWAVGSVLEVAAVDFSTKVFWIKFQAVWQLPTATALTCFVLEYARLGRWLTRRNLILLSVPPFLALVLIITNDYHHLFWTQFPVGEYILKVPGGANWFFLGYGYILALVNIIALLWLAIRSSQHRWPVIIMVFGQMTGRGLYLLDHIYDGFLGPGESVFVVLGFLASMYALALFRFHVFDPVPLARATVIEQMGDGMLVFDLLGQIVDLNPAAEKALGELAIKLRRTPLDKILPMIPPPDKTGIVHSEISLCKGDSIRYFNLTLTSLIDRRGQSLGQLLLLHDVTEQKQAQARLIEQQQVMATLQERERLAHELHDSIGQVLGYLSMQAQTIKKYIRDGNAGKAEPLLTRLVEVAQDAHADVRESIFGLKAGLAQEWSFTPALMHYLDDFQAHYGIHTELIIPETWVEETFEPKAEVQLLRVIQEALTNARKHSGARTVRITFERENDQARIIIADDGCGFDPNQSNRDGNRHFGLSFMRERVAELGGFMTIDSRPGAGTTIRLEAPIRGQMEEKE